MLTPVSENAFVGAVVSTMKARQAVARGASTVGTFARQQQVPSLVTAPPGTEGLPVAPTASEVLEIRR